MVNTLKSPFYSSLCIGKQADKDTVATSYQKLEVEDIGGLSNEVKKAIFTPLSDDRSDRTGTVTLNSAKVDGVKTVLKQHNLVGFLASALMANINQPPSTKPLYGLTSSTPITGMTTTVLTASGGGVSTRFKVRDIVQLRGWTNTALNVKTFLTAVDTTTMTLNDTLAETESISGTARYVDKVGHRFASGVLSLAVSGSTVVLASSDTSGDGAFDTMGFELGQWVFVGGDSSATKFASNGVGLARISAIAASSLTFDLVTWAPTNDSGTSKTIELYWGSCIKNRSSEANILSWYWTIAGKLGLDNDGQMIHLAKSAMLDELKLTMPRPDDNSMVMAEMNFIPTAYFAYAGSDAGSAPSSNILSATSEVSDTFYTTSSDFRIAKVYKYGTGANPTNQYALITDIEISTKNNLEAQAFVTNSVYSDVVAKNLEITGKFNAALSTITPLNDIKNDTKYGMLLYWSHTFDGRKCGIIIDIPYVDVTTTGTKVSKGDAIITIPVDFRATWDATKLTTMSFQVCDSLPDWAVSTATTYI